MGMRWLRVAVMLALAATAGCERNASAPQASGTTAEVIEDVGRRYRVVRVPQSSIRNLRLVWRRADGSRYANFAAVSSELERSGLRIAFATNAGIFDPTHSPVGLHVEAGEEVVPLNSADGAGNFFLKPNGVFVVRQGRGEICASEKYQAGAGATIATQSGPLLLRRGQGHPAFDPKSENRKVRSAVGVARSGDALFVLSEDRVSFHELATMFRDRLDCPDALYLDGEISKFYAPAFGWDDAAGDFAGMLVLVEPRP